MNQTTLSFLLIAFILPVCLAQGCIDTNADGVVDTNDLFLLLGGWGPQTCATNPTTDCAAFDILLNTTCPFLDDRFLKNLPGYAYGVYGDFRGELASGFNLSTSNDLYITDDLGIGDSLVVTNTIQVGLAPGSMASLYKSYNQLGFPTFGGNADPTVSNSDDVAIGDDLHVGGTARISFETQIEGPLSAGQSSGPQWGQSHHVFGQNATYAFDVNTVNDVEVADDLLVGDRIHSGGAINTGYYPGGPTRNCNQMGNETSDGYAVDSANDLLIHDDLLVKDWARISKLNVSNTVTVGKMRVEDRVTRKYWISGASCINGQGSNQWGYPRYDRQGGFFVNPTCCDRAHFFCGAINLPYGAVVTKMVAFWADGGSYNMYGTAYGDSYVQLFRTAFGQNSRSGSIMTHLQIPNLPWNDPDWHLSHSNSSINHEVIDNDNYMYYLEGEVRVNGTYNTFGQVDYGFAGATIEYTIPDYG